MIQRKVAWQVVGGVAGGDFLLWTVLSPVAIVFLKRTRPIYCALVVLVLRSHHARWSHPHANPQP